MPRRLDAILEDDPPLLAPVVQEPFGLVAPCVAGLFPLRETLAEVVEHDAVPFVVEHATVARMEAFVGHSVVPLVDALEAAGEDQLAVAATEDALGDARFDGELLGCTQLASPAVAAISASGSGYS